MLSVLVLFVLVCNAAVPPLSDTDRKSTAAHIFTGSVLAIYHQDIQHSKGDDFSDRNYIAEVEIQSVEKGAEKLPKEVVFIKYWSPLKRPAGWTGPQGQMPKLRDRWTYRFFTSEVSQGSAELLEPNGTEKLSEEPTSEDSMGQGMPSRPIDEL